MSIYRPDWELRSRPAGVTRRFVDGVDGCPEVVVTADCGYELNPDWCQVHGRRLDREVAS